jgi:hypothetical protein
VDVSLVLGDAQERHVDIDHPCQNDVMFNRAVASQMTIKRKIKDEFVRLRLAKLFRSEARKAVP